MFLPRNRLVLSAWVSQQKNPLLPRGLWSENLSHLKQLCRAAVLFTAQAGLLLLGAAAIAVAKLIALLGSPGFFGSGGCKRTVVCPLLAVLSLFVFAFSEYYSIIL